MDANNTYAGEGGYARGVALEIITDVLDGGAFYSDAANRRLDKDTRLSAKDRGFISAIAIGTIERAIELDYLLSAYCRKPLSGLKPYIRNILRMSAYQIRHMRGVPDSAAVNEAVNLAAKKGYGGLKGYVNGVLRNFARTADALPYPDREAECDRYLSVAYSMPAALVRHFTGELGYAGAESAFKYFLEPPPVTIRCTGRRYCKDELASAFRESGIDVSEGEFFDYALRLAAPGGITGLKGYAEGSFFVQDESSMIPAHALGGMLDAGGSYKVLDICAAPGGKALQLAASKGKDIRVDAMDASEERVRLIRGNAKRLHVGNVCAGVSDALVRDPSRIGKYDAVIADLPCSGLGVLARKPDIKYKASAEGMGKLAATQGRMLDIAAGYVKAGGYIIYSTCTLNKSENEDNAAAFLERHGDFVIENLREYVPEALRGYVTGEGMVKVVPGRARADGFFVAAFKRKL